MKIVASVGIKEVIELMNKTGVPIAGTEFSAKLSKAEQNQEVTKMLAEKSKTTLSTSPQTPLQGSTHKGGEHMYSFDYDYAYLLSPSRK